MSLTSYINSLIDNVENNVPSEIDLILDGGAFNGIYMLGGLLYLKEIEKRKKIKIKRISGCSIGAILGILFIIDKLDISLNICNESYKILRKHQDLKKLKKIIEKTLTDEINDDDMTKLNGNVYITYFDTVKRKQVIKKNYKNVIELRESILKSMHVPYLFDGNITDTQGCVDGSFPYIFKKKINNNKERKILFMNLQSFDKILNMLYIKSEKNIYPRLFNGIMDIHDFFSKCKNTSMCSYVNNWGIKDIIIFRLREIIYTFVIYCLSAGLYIDYFFPEKWKRDSIIQRYISIFKNTWRDFMIYLTI